MQMKMKSTLAGLALATTALFAVSGSVASAAPAITNAVSAKDDSIVVLARRDCVWVDNKWTYQRGDKRLVCRPDRPTGQGWNWHREGTRYGWYNSGRKSWHNRNW